MTLKILLTEWADPSICLTLKLYLYLHQVSGKTRGTPLPADLVFATLQLSFDGEYLENGEPFSNFCIYMISASSSICILRFRQIDGVLPPTLVKFSKDHATLTLTCAVPGEGGGCSPRSGFFFCR